MQLFAPLFGYPTTLNMIGWEVHQCFSEGSVHFGGGVYSTIARLVNIFKEVYLRKHLSINITFNPEKILFQRSEAKIRLLLFI